MSQGSARVSLFLLPHHFYRGKKLISLGNPSCGFPRGLFALSQKTAASHEHRADQDKNDRPEDFVFHLLLHKVHLNTRLVSFPSLLPWMAAGS